MSFQTRKIFVNLRSTYENIFWWNPRAFWVWPCIDSNTDTFKAQKGSEDIVTKKYSRSFIKLHLNN